MTEATARAKGYRSTLFYCQTKTGLDSDLKKIRDADYKASIVRKMSPTRQGMQPYFTIYAEVRYHLNNELVECNRKKDLFASQREALEARHAKEMRDLLDRQEAIYNQWACVVSELQNLPK